MKYCVLVVSLFLLCTATLQSQDEQSKKPARVIDNENIGSVTANSSGVQDATVTQPGSEDSTQSGNADGENPAKVSAPEEKPPTAKERLTKLKEQEASWSQTIEIAHKKLQNATSDLEKSIWSRNLASAEDGLSETRREIPKAEAAAKAEEAQQQEQAPAPSPIDGSAQQ